MKITKLILLIVLLGCSHNSDWVDTYSWSNGYEGEILEIKPGGSFIYTPFTDAKIAGYESYYTGTYVEEDSVLKLNLTHFVEESSNKKMNGFSGTRKSIIGDIPIRSVQFDSILYKISWGPTKYLISRDNLVHFVSDINSQIEPRGLYFHRFLTSSEEDKKAVNGFPNLPSGYQNLIDTSLVTGQITEVLSDSTVVIQFEQNSNIYPGFMFWSNSYSFEITNTDNLTATAKVYGPFPNYPYRYLFDFEDMGYEDSLNFGFSEGDTVLNRVAR